MSTPGIVVDASVARASGTSGTPPSPVCASVLDAIRDAKLPVLLSTELNTEWKKHQSDYFDRWKKVAFSRKQIKKVALAKLETLIVDLHDAPLAVEVHDSTAAASARKAMTKDAHLIALGAEHRGRVIALDDAARRHFASVAEHVSAVRSVHWANPVHEEEEVVPWIEAGVPDDASRQLGRFGSPVR